MKLLLLDGHYYLYRSFFAIRGLSNSRGEPTNAIYGFVKALRKMLLELQPDLAAVIWDAGIPSYRLELQPAYKKDRQEMPEELKLQQEPLRQLLPMMGVKNVLLEGMEADDLIASYATAAQKEGMSTIIATNDKDILQVVNDQVAIYSVAKADLANHAKPGAAFSLLGREAILQKWGVMPEQMVDLLALTGDNVDGIPGIPGVGKKTAAKWLQRYGSLEQIFKGIGVGTTAQTGLIAGLESEVRSGLDYGVAAGVGLETSSEAGSIASQGVSFDTKLREKIAPHHQVLRNNQKMIKLDCELPLPLPLDQLEITPAYQQLLPRLAELEFRSLHRELSEEAKFWLEQE